MKLSVSQIAKVSAALAQHSRHANAYFWKPTGNAAARRQTEKQNTFKISFKCGGKRYEYGSDVTCSCANYYYRGTFTLDGAKKTSRAFSNLLAG